MALKESTQVKTSKVSCDGGGGPLGHPRVFLKLGDDGQVVCPYCSNRFELDGVPDKASNH